MKNQKKWIPSIGMVFTVCTLLLTLTGCATTIEGKQNQENSGRPVQEAVSALMSNEMSSTSSF